jgi:hypothetical protein
MTNKIRLFSVLTLAVAITATSCKKTVDKIIDFNTELSSHSDDQFNASSQSDEVDNDANIAIENFPSFSGRLQGADSAQALPCNTTVTIDTTTNPRKVTITYNGLNCSGTTTRTGVVVLSMPAGVHWKDVGAVLTINFQNLKLTRVSDNRSITINGTQTITNVNGGRIFTIANNGPVTHAINSDNMSITFDNNTQRTWHIAKRRVFSYNNGIVITTTGTHSDGTTTNIAEWGLNRFGNPFTSSISQPMVIRQDCNFRLTSGQIEHHGWSVTASVTFGLDSSGNATTCPGTGHYYYKLIWTGAGGTPHTVILPY